SPKLCIRPVTLQEALWTQLVLAIDKNVNLGACVQCRKWFTLEAGRGRPDKKYCSNACRMRAYRKRKGSGGEGGGGDRRRVRVLELEPVRDRPDRCASRGAWTRLKGQSALILPDYMRGDKASAFHEAS